MLAEIGLAAGLLVLSWSIGYGFSALISFLRAAFRGG
jgi:hypothetical protein